MIFTERTYSPREYRLAASRAFCPTGPGGGLDNSCSPTKDSSPSGDDWRSAGENKTLRWKGDSLSDSPLSSSEGIASFKISNAGGVREAIDNLSISLDEAVSLGGGAVRGSHISVHAFDSDSIDVTHVTPIDPSDPDSGVIDSSIEIIRDPDSGEMSLHYGTLFPMQMKEDESGAYGVGDMEHIPPPVQTRIASLMMEKFISSASFAEGKGFAYAEMLAVGDKKSRDKGYRLWPQFGFDGPLPPSTIKKIPNEILFKAAGIDPPRPGSARIPQSTILMGLRGGIGKVTVQQLISTREGERWWDENGHSIDLRLDFKDKSGLGYRRFSEMKAKLPSLKARNKNRSYYDLFVEFREDCGRDEGGRFGSGNDCAAGDGGGTSVADRPSPSRKDTWTEMKGSIYWGKGELEYGPPVTGGEVLKSFKVDDAQSLRKSLDNIADIDTLDDVVAIAGGVRKGGEIFVAGEGVAISVVSDLPISPEGDRDSGYINIEVSMVGGDDDGPSTVMYDSLDVFSGDEPSEGSQARVSSLLMQKMIESLSAAEANQFERAETVAAGSRTGKLKGYRLWPQFGFDGVIPKSVQNRLEEFAREAVGSRGEDDSDNPPKWAIDLLDTIDAGDPVRVQQLISTTEGDRWWNENGRLTSMELDFTDKSSLGYKRYEKIKSRLKRLRDRNESRGLDDLCFAEFRDADCGRTPDGKFGPKNDCAGDGSQPSPTGIRGFGTEGDESLPESLVESVDSKSGKIAVLNRDNISNMDYLDEVESHARDVGIAATFDEAIQLVEAEEAIEPEWEPLNAYIGDGYGYFTGQGYGEGYDEIDSLGAEYGAIDDYMAEEMVSERLAAKEDEWGDFSDEEKARNAGETLQGWLDMTDKERQDAKNTWLEDARSEIQEYVDDDREEARENAVERMKDELERSVASETIKCCLQLYRGLKVESKGMIEQILRDGYVTHEGVNSWTTSRGVAQKFGAAQLVLICRKPRVGHVFANNRHKEMEIIRPPSKMKILGAVKTREGYAIYVDEDEDYKEV